MAVTVVEKSHRDRGYHYEVALSAVGDVVQARFETQPGSARQARQGYGMNWLAGDVSWYVSAAAVTVTYTNEGEDAFAVDTSGDSTTTGWLAHPDDANQAAAETIPISGIRFKASAAAQTVTLWTGVELLEAPKSVSGV